LFGFLRLAKKGLSSDHRAAYNAHFCAACHANADFGGRLTSLLTSYDQTFLLLVFSALDEQGGQTPIMRPCTGLPLRRVAVQPMSPTARPLLAALNVLLVDAKLKDDVEDDGRLRSRVGQRLLSGRSERARQLLQEHGFPLDVIARLGERQRDVESSSRPDLWTLSSPTAEMLAEVFAFVAPLTRRPKHASALRQLGESLGRFLYVWDALQDMRADQKAARFNALVAVFGSTPDEAQVRGFLLQWLRTMEHALEELPLGARMALTSQVVGTLRAKVKARLGDVAPPVRPRATAKVSWRRTMRDASDMGWLHAVRHRAHLQRGDADCDCCSGCCDSADCCNCCTSCDGMTAKTFFILLAIAIVVIIIMVLTSHHQGDPPPHPSVIVTPPGVTRPASTRRRRHLASPSNAPSPLSSPAPPSASPSSSSW